MAEKFETLEDAKDFINGQLVSRGFLKNGQSLSVNGEKEDAKLVVNTIHKLLKTIRAKEAQLNEWHSRSQREQRQVAAAVPPPPAVPRQSRGPMISKRRTVTRAVDNDRVRKMFKVRANKLQSTIDELKDKIQRDKYRDNDVTWRVHQDLTTPVNETRSSDDLREQLTLLLQGQSAQQELCSELIIFLDNVNRFTYSSAILGITEVPLREQHSQVLDKLQNSEDQTIAAIIEFINDWYQIIEIESSEPRDRT
ncbi:hypothetical protein HG537_0G03920 [Torulaspora globosa]|uniref:Uncharacterized protein n=1 Tax=Torulaspora globosa TaxID=48254 RepID=A0A7H9HZ18_9SACH|nr:hypothetical protein HG537_0G03920 [Torulaspora sp. CBS 2947]